MHPWEKAKAVQLPPTLGPALPSRDKTWPGACSAIVNEPAPRPPEAAFRARGESDWEQCALQRRLFLVLCLPARVQHFLAVSCGPRDGQAGGTRPGGAIRSTGKVWCAESPGSSACPGGPVPPVDSRQGLLGLAGLPPVPGGPNAHTQACRSPARGAPATQQPSRWWGWDGRWQCPSWATGRRSHLLYLCPQHSRQGPLRPGGAGYNPKT